MSGAGEEGPRDGTAGRHDRAIRKEYPAGGV
jgi:hypothetical protein